MTALVEERCSAGAAADSASADAPFDWAFAAWILGATAAALLMAWPALRLVLQGGFGDPDDALRLAEVRAWLAGQPWFDVAMHRLDPPTGAAMHWSRLVDVPNALLIRLFGLVVDPAQAERLDRIVLPTLWLVALYLGMARLAACLLGRQARGVAILGLLLSGVTLVQVQPGRIGHHAPSTVLLVLAVASLLAAFDPRRARTAILAGAVVALSLAISLETLPLLAALCLALALAWVWRGAPLAPALSAFAIGLVPSLLLLDAVTVAPARWLVPVADALGPGHVEAGLIGGLGALALAAATPRLATVGARGAAAAAFGLLLVAVVLVLAPELLHGPFAGIDPLVRAVWLDQVFESKPLDAVAAHEPMLALAVAAPTALGTAALLAVAVWEMRRDKAGLAGLRFAAVALLGLVGLGLGLWQLRGFASATPLALCGGLAVVEIVRRHLVAHGLSTAALLAPAAILPFTSLGWALVVPADPAPARPAHACLAPAALAPLAALPAGRAVAPLETGSHLIATTALDPFAGPYHRNNDGNRFTLDVWAAPPATAESLLRQRDVAYVVTCPGEGDIARMAARAPNGLAARLADGKVPAFLVPLPLAATPYRVYAVRPAAP